jgi:hypothetical protein
MSDQRFDAEIDDVAREMTRGGELPADFRARVIARLESGDDRAWTLRPAWVLSTLAAAAVVLLAVLVVRAPWRSGPSTARPEPFDSPLIQSPSKDERLAQERLVEGRALGVGAPGATRPYGGPDFSRITSAELTSVVPSYVGSGFSRTTEQSVAGDLTPAPIAVESLDVEAMEPMEVAPLTVDAMESIDVPRLDVAPLEVPAIAE